MRMWMVDPQILCQKHLLGEHVECHMFAGVIRKNISLDGYVKNNLLEIRSLQQRHEDLVVEMLSRNMDHKSIFLINFDIEKYEDHILNFKIDKELALHDLLSRCRRCRKRWEELTWTED